MNAGDNNIIWWILIAIAGLCIVYLAPFIASPILKVFFSLWGFFLGRSKRKVLIAYAPTTTEQNEQLVNFETAVKKVADSEYKMLEDSLSRQRDRLSKEVERLDKKIDGLEAGFEKRREAVRESLVKKVFDTSSSQLNTATGTNILWLVLIAALLSFDTLIAKEIFISFGVATKTLDVWGLSVEYAWIAGLFVTIISALFLHIFWDTSKFATFLKSKWSIVAGGALVAVIFATRLLMFANPDLSGTLTDLLLIVCWLAGVLIVYWILDQIIGEEKSWFRLLVALFAPVLIILIVAFGGLLIFQYVFDWLVTNSIEAWIGLRRSRSSQQLQNTESGYEAQKSGFYRGLTT